MYKVNFPYHIAMLIIHAYKLLHPDNVTKTTIVKVKGLLKVNKMNIVKDAKAFKGFL